MLFPENTHYRVPNNPFRVPLPKKLKEDHKKSLQEAVTSLRAPFLFDIKEPIKFDGSNVGAQTSMEEFNAAVTTVIAAIERGYYPIRDSTPLATTEWTRLSCALLAAVGRGYHRQYTNEHENLLERVRAETIDPNPLPDNPTMFHRLSAIACDVSDHIGMEQEGHQDWYRTIKDEFSKKAQKAAIVEVDEKWHLWKADRIDRLAEEFKQEIATHARREGIDYLIETSQRLGLTVTRDENAIDTIPQPPTTGRKRSNTGALTSAGPATPTMKRIMAPQGRTPSPSATPRCRTVILQEAPPKLNGTPITATATNAGLDLDTIMTAIKAAMGPAIQSAMAPYAAKISALEKATLPPQPAREEARRNIVNPPEPAGVEASMWAPAEPAQPTTVGNDGFTTVTHKAKGRKTMPGRNANASAHAPPQQSNPTQASYAGTAAAAAGNKQPPPPPKRTTSAPTSTEVTIIRSGGHIDTQLEEDIRSRPADAIVREVKLKMGKAVAKPIPLKAGRWSVHPRSKGNFVYSFEGNVPFSLITTYEHILLAPFRGTGQLCPSMGWTRLLAHGVPVWDDYLFDSFSPEALLNEVKSIPSLQKAHFAMPPRWLKPAERIQSLYSSITFAISDPDGTITSNLLKSRPALFGKDVVIQRWVDKPALVQCSHCHALGHIKSSRACTLSKDSVKCHKCGGPHASKDHDQSCPSKRHAVAGICDCKTYKCLNCHKTGHDCRDSRCPARDLFRPRPSRGPRRPRGRDKGKERAFEEGPRAASPGVPLEDIMDPDDDLYNPPPLPPNPTGPQIREALHDRSIANIFRPPSQAMEVDSGTTANTYDTSEFPEALNNGPPGPATSAIAEAQLIDYSPSRAHSSVATKNLA